MTSEERREVRYQRRKARRLEKKQAEYGKCDDFDWVFSYDHLYHSYKMSRRNVAWKASVQRYITQAPLQVLQTYNRLQKGTFKSSGFFEFNINERGKKRHIRSVLINERVVQRCLCDYALTPMLQRTFIYDNCASLKGKGYDFAVKRLTAQLQKHYRKYGTDGYILLFDFSKFFDRVSHELIKSILREEFTDKRIIALTDHFIDMFGSEGVGLGSQISQIFALASANRLDHYIKEVLRIRSYGRYMDDGYLISSNKRHLKYCLEKIKDICNLLGIKLNEKKTQIVKLSHGFTWLKIRFFITKSGKVVRKIYRGSVTRMRVKLKKLGCLLRDGKISLRDVYNSWQSWRSHAMRFNAYTTLQSMEVLYARTISFTKNQ